MNCIVAQAAKVVDGNGIVAQALLALVVGNLAVKQECMHLVLALLQPIHETRAVEAAADTKSSTNVAIGVDVGHSVLLQL